MLFVAGPTAIASSAIDREFKMSSPSPRLALLAFLAGALIVACQETPDLRANPQSNQPSTPESTPDTTASSHDAGAAGGQYSVLQKRDDRLIVELPNRMVLVAQSVPTAPIVSVQAWVKTGSLYEQEHVGAGLSHFLEHLISGGSTTTRPESESTRVLGAIGAQTNAATSLDTVRYYINTTSTHASTAIDLLTDWMQNSVISDSEYQRERDVIQREFSMGQGDPGRIHWKLTQQARFSDAPDHPGAHPTIGYLDEFLKISRDEIFDFYKRMYVPNNMVFVVVGDIDPAATVDQLTRLWAGEPSGELPSVSFPLMNRAAPPVDVTGVASIKRPRVRLLWPGVKLASEHDFALDLLAGILGGGESSRLVRDLRDNRQLVSAIDAFNYSAQWGEGFFGVDYELNDPSGDEAVRSAVIGHIERLRVEPVTDEELARAKRQVLARVLASGQSAEALAASLAGNIIASADPDYLRHYAQRVQELTAQDLLSAAEYVLNVDQMSSATLEPAAEGQEIDYPTRPPMISEADARPVETIDLDNHPLVSLLRNNLAGIDENLEPVEVDAPIVGHLANGLTVVAQRSTVVPAVSMQLYSKGGLLADEPGREGVSNAAYAMLMRGTRQRGASELAAAIEDLGAGLDTGSGNNTGYVRASSLREDWTRVLELMGEVLLEPAFEPDEWDRLKPRLLASIDRSTDSWAGELQRDFREAYYGEHPWSQLSAGRREIVEELDVAALSAFYQSRLDASQSVLAVVGDIDPEAVMREAERVFGSMPGQAGEPMTLPQPSEPSPGLTIHMTAKPVAAVQLGYGPGITRDSSDYAAVQVLSRVIGDFPAGWLQQELRGREQGLVYASNAGAMTGLVPGYFTMLFNTQPDTVDEALAKTLSVAERARTELVDEGTLARAKAKVLTNEFFGRQSNSDLAAGQALDLLYGVDDLSGREFLAEVESLTPEDIRTAARKYLGRPVAVVITHDTIDEAVIEGLLELE